MVRRLVSAFVPGDLCEELCFRGSFQKRGGWPWAVTSGWTAALFRGRGGRQFSRKGAKSAKGIQVYIFSSSWRAFGMLLAVLLLGCGVEELRTVSAGPSPERIISMSPALTETLFALGLGDRVVGVTQFCFYPEDALALPKIGGYLDPNWEAIVALEPDLVVLMESHTGAESHLNGLGIPTIRINQQGVGDILDSFEQLAGVCGVSGRGEALRLEVEENLERISILVAGRPEPRVIVSAGRPPGSGRLKTVWAAGPGSFFDDVLSLAGGVNVVPGGVAGAYPEISLEGLLQLDPDDIIDVIPELEASGMDAGTALDDWQGLRSLRAVREGRVHVLGRHSLSIPGPRVAEVVEAFAKVLHPEVPWG
ncbi:MAG: ABC transporter substrate-binding protein [Acidobacteria bacterium]|nr:MAG: ABC transporter substrate-binding protein [Acidobacteriota bacterium]